MHFAFDPQQLEFRQQLRALAERRCTPADLRAAWDSEQGWSPERWRALSELGVLGLTVPAVHGGLGLGFVDLVLILEEAGRSGLPEPLVDSLAVAAPLLGGLGGGHAEKWLPELVSGRLAIGVSEPGRFPYLCAGTHLGVVFDGNELHLMAPTPQGEVTRRSIDGARHFVDVGAQVTSGTVVAGGSRAAAEWRSACDRGAWGSAAVLVGVADRLVSTAAEYAGQRVQFGKPIGSFQAVKHQLADALVELEFARPLVYRAAWSLDEGDAEVWRHASMGKAAASDAANLAASTALQVHGAIGYTWEHDLHLWMKRAWALAGAWGDAGWHRARLLGLVDW